MRFEILGPMRVTDQDLTRSVAGVRQRIMLGALLAHANQPVPAERLAEFVWDGAPPPGAVATLRTYVTRLRHSLGPAGASRIATRDAGYLVEIGEDELDTHLFDTLGRAVGSAIRARQWTDASATATRALALWRGAPLVDAPSQALHERWVPHLEQHRLQVVEWRIEAELHLDQHERLVPQLNDLIAQHPLREHLHAQLMLVLARSGRQAEALAAYRDARRVLVDELGIEPGPELHELHQRILAGDAELLALARPHNTPQATRAPAAPRQLPATVGHFAGRANELKVLSGLLGQGSDTVGAVVISAIGGTAGIGKTALAVHWARQVTDRFPDGQLYVNLRGFDPSGTPLQPSTVVKGFLDALGVPAQRIPADPDQQAALYRSQLAERRMLVLLDNARDVEQVRPLLPGAPGCLVLVTSRNQLGALVALDGAVPLTLDLLDHDEARALLGRRLGHERLAAHEQAVTELIEACARLPLALNIAAAHATLRPARSLPELVDELRDVRRRLDTLTLGQGTADVRTVFSWSYHALGPQAARVFRLLGVHPGPDVSLPAAANLTALDLDRTRRVLAELTAAHLLTEHAPGRYTFHDLLRAYATEQAHAHDNETERHDALRRVCDFYAHTAHTADRLLDPHRQPIGLDPPVPATHTLRLPDVPAAMAWFEAEHPNLLAAQRTAATHAWHPTVWQLAWTLTTFHRRRAHRHDHLAVWQAALDAADHLPDPTTRARAHRYLGVLHAELRHPQESIGHLHQALTLAEHLDPAEQAHTHLMLAALWERRGDDRRALHHATSARDLCRGLGQPTLEAEALNTVGWYAARLGDYDTARLYCRNAMALHQRHHHPAGEAATLDSLGYIEHHTGHHHQAIDHYQHALTLLRGLDDAYYCADTLDHLGHPHAALGHRQQARTVWQQALELYRQQERTQDAEHVQHQLDTLDHPNGRGWECLEVGSSKIFVAVGGAGVSVLVCGGACMNAGAV